MATFDDFQKIDIRVGEIIKAEDFPEARKPSYKLKINLGDGIGIKKSIAQLAQNYKIEEYEKININLKDELTRINEELETFKKVTETDHAEELKNEIVLLNQKLTEKDTIIQNNTVVMLKTK